MKHHILIALLAASFAFMAPTVSVAGPIDNGDGSKTCNASGPSGGASDGVCANDLATNEGYCEGGMSTEPGGGVTCSEGRTEEPRKTVKTVKKN